MTKNSNFRGIDTLHTYLDGYSFDYSSKILQKNHFIEQNVLDSADTMQYKYFSNRPYNAEDKKSKKYSIEIDKGYLNIKMSIPKYLNKSNDNTELADKNDLMDYKDKLKKDLNGLGIDIDDSKMNIARIDTTNNADMKYKTTEYIGMLKNININSIKQNGKLLYDTTLDLFNKSYGFSIYDKVFEQDGKTISNKLRNEIRIYKNRNIEKKLGIKNIDDLIINFNDTMDRARDFEKEKIFNNEYIDKYKLEETEKITNCIKFVIDKNKKLKYKNANIGNQIITLIGINEIVKSDNLEYTIDIIMSNLDFNSQQAYRNYKYKLKKYFNKICKEAFIFEKSKNNISYMDLYNECLLKLVA